MRIAIPLHVAMNLVWIGAILATGLLLARGPGDAKQRGEAGRLVYRTLAVPGFVGSIVLGLIQLGRDPDLYLKATHFMHAKLTLAIAIIGLHHVIGARARKMASGAAADAGPVWILAQLIAVLSLGVTYLAIAKPF